MPTPPAIKTGPISFARKRERSMVMFPLAWLRSRHIALEGDEAAEHGQGDSEAGEKAGIGDDPGGDEVGELRRDDAERADTGEHPADRGHDAAPVARPHVMGVDDVEAGGEPQDSGKVDERKAA